MLLQRSQASETWEIGFQTAFLSDLDMVDNQFFTFVIEDVDVHIE